MNLVNFRPQNIIKPWETNILDICFNLFENREKLIFVSHGLLMSCGWKFTKYILNL